MFILDPNLVRDPDPTTRICDPGSTAVVTKVKRIHEILNISFLQFESQLPFHQGLGSCHILARIQPKNQKTRIQRSNTKC